MFASFGCEPATVLNGWWLSYRWVNFPFFFKKNAALGL
jgi:hypothetical protein